MSKIREIELLSPAKDAECAFQAILHGADAVYIGAPKFGARASAVNDLSDIKSVVQYAHKWKVKVYVALNVIIYENELDEVRNLIFELWNIGVDALIIQDMGITMMEIPPIPLHASTQVDNRTLEKVEFLEKCGFQQVVLARELSLKDITEIATKTKIPLEFFVHGALCVSYSGQCYLSHAMCSRSANRGECAQYCRLPYNLIDNNGRILEKQKHLLSLKDLNLSNHIEDLINAGISSFKIEGRLKDASYVKNVTAWYRSKIDDVIKTRTDLKRSSLGFSRIGFDSDVSKSFNRGFTSYFVDKRQDNLINKDTPKSIGEFIGTVGKILNDRLIILTDKELSNGDGLSFKKSDNTFDGFRVNRVEQNIVFPARMPEIKPGTLLYRTLDQSFERVLEKAETYRVIPVKILCNETRFGFYVEMSVIGSNLRAGISFESEKVLAKKNQKENVIKELSKLGNTVYSTFESSIDWSEEWFVPISTWADIRRKLVDKLDFVIRLSNRSEIQKRTKPDCNYPQTDLSYLGNVSNSKAVEFYKSHGVLNIDPAFELSSDSKGVLMQNKYCILFELGYCHKQGFDSSKLNKPLFLENNGRKVRLHFDCQKCEMKILSD